MLATILAQQSLLPVKEAEDGCSISPGMVYIAPPDYHLLVNPDSTLSLNQSERVNFVRPSAEWLFESVANSYKDRAIAVVLTGAGKDGMLGVQAIHRLGGVVIAQDQKTSECFSMPQAAIQTGMVDFILPLPQIAPKLISLVTQLPSS